MINGGISPFLQPNTDLLCTNLKLKMAKIAQEPNNHEGKTSRLGAGVVAATMG